MLSDRLIKRRDCLAKARAFINAGDVTGLKSYIESPEVQALPEFDRNFIASTMEAAVLTWSINNSKQ